MKSKIVFIMFVLLVIVSCMEVIDIKDQTIEGDWKVFYNTYGIYAKTSKAGTGKSKYLNKGESFNLLIQNYYCEGTEKEGLIYKEKKGKQIGTYYTNGNRLIMDIYATYDEVKFNCELEGEVNLVYDEINGKFYGSVEEENGTKYNLEGTFGAQRVKEEK